MNIKKLAEIQFVRYHNSSNDDFDLSKLLIDELMKKKDVSKKIFSQKIKDNLVKHSKKLFHHILLKICILKKIANFCDIIDNLRSISRHIADTYKHQISCCCCSNSVDYLLNELKLLSSISQEKFDAVKNNFFARMQMGN